MPQPIVTLEGNELYRFVESMRILVGMRDALEGPDVVEVMIQEDGLKFKADYDSWTRPFGETRMEG